MKKLSSGVVFTLMCAFAGSFPGSLMAQSTMDESGKEWYIMDPADDNMQGVSSEKAYKTLLKGKESKTVIVAVIDSGVDIDHEDLQGKIWINEDEIEGNGKDDDNNGYIDDRYGWNFIGGKDGNVSADTYELTRVYKVLKAKYEGADPKKIKKKQKGEYEYWLKVKADFEETYNKAKQQYDFYVDFRKNLVRYNSLLTAYLDVEKLTMNDLKKLDSKDSIVLMGRNVIGSIFQRSGPDTNIEDVIEQLDGAVEHFGNQVNYAYNVDFDSRAIIGDDYSNLYEKGYGNSDVKGSDPSHGTHVSGIIAADRHNNIGIKGIADNVKIMVVRAVPDGDERDKDVANAIIYAVDNGAQIINMSFGKSYSPDKEAVDKAVRYAESKGVLLVHAAGNSSKNIDKSDNFPTKRLNGKNSVATNWIEVGASSVKNDATLPGNFSNYGKNTVDVFAPGVDIYSTTPGNTYKSFNGTSMASPSTAGVAALVMSYYPNLTAVQVKEIIEKSSRKFDDLKVNTPGTKGVQVPFKELSITGGLVNAYEALKMAQTMSK